MKSEKSALLYPKAVTDEFMERIQQHSRYLYNIAYRLTGNTEDAKDLTQETMWQAHCKSHKYVYEKSLKAWLRTMMTNRFRDQKRKKSLKLVALEDAFIVSNPTSSHMQSVEEQVEQRIMLDKVKEEIAKLPDIYKRVIVLRHFEGLTYAEISEQLDIPEGTVKTQLVRARRMLRDRMAE